MSPRLVAFLIAVVMCWSGFMTQEHVVFVASGYAEQVASSDTVDPRHDGDDGSVEDHHLDDQPGQSQSGSAADLPALVMDDAQAKSSSLTMSRPAPYVVATWFTPFLDGPQRPPCARLSTA
jgi:hypothetical protein